MRMRLPLFLMVVLCAGAAQAGEGGDGQWKEMLDKGWDKTRELGGRAVDKGMEYGKSGWEKGKQLGSEGVEKAREAVVDPWDDQPRK